MAERILVDVNVPKDVCDRLNEIGYKTIYLTDIFPKDIEDKKILDWMEDTQTPILTRDKEFPENGGDLKIDVTSESSIRLTRRAFRKLMAKNIFPEPLQGSWNGECKKS